ncbi:hypothetical protein [Streptomyces erythrochromogenes]|nr:hypothetical protein [Streptomyces erythrochromogenes]
MRKLDRPLRARVPDFEACRFDSAAFYAQFADEGRSPLVTADGLARPG